jgi:hypothetical protein
VTTQPLLLDPASLTTSSGDIGLSVILIITHHAGIMPLTKRGGYSPLFIISDEF